jgi:hypothetical protein
MVAGADRTQVKGFRRNEALRSCQITPDRNWAGFGRPARRPGFQLVGDVSFNSGASLSPYTANGKPLADGQGPCRIVAPQEKRSARGIRMTQRIQVVKIQ